MHLRRYFEAKIREPYMGNTLPVKVEVKVYENGNVTIKVVNPEGIFYDAKEIDIEAFNR